MRDKSIKPACWLPYAVLILVFFTSQTRAKSSSDTLKVGVSGGVPFVVDIDQQSGISLEIWQTAADREALNYKLVPFDNVPDALSEMSQGKIDAVVGPLSITPERAKRMRFTQPYYQSSLSIMTRSTSPDVWHRIGKLFNAHLLYAVVVFLLVLAIVGTLLWLAEHEVNSEQFSSHPVLGIGDGMWCAIVTMTTTGYGDISPKTLWGRITAGAWMVLSIVFATTLVAGIASSLSLAASNTNLIEKASQLSNRKVAVVKSSPSDAFVKQYDASKVYIENLKEGYDALKAEQVDAVVFDRPQMLYFLKNHHDEDVAISQYHYMRQGYGFALPLDSKKLHNLDITLLRLQESGRIGRIVSEWLGENN